jgi:hypothetical protein
MEFDVRSGAPDKDARLAPLLVTRRGQLLSATPFEVDGRVDSPLALQDAARPYHVRHERTRRRHPAPTSPQDILSAPACS